MQVEQAMYSKLLMTDPDRTVDDAVREMDSRNIGSLLVEEDGEITGIVTTRDVLRKVVAKGLLPSVVSVRQIMSTPLISVAAEDDLQTAADKMSENNIRRLVVTKQGKVVGVTSLKLIAKNLRFMQKREFINDHLERSVAEAVGGR